MQRIKTLIATLLLGLLVVGCTSPSIEKNAENTEIMTFAEEYLQVFQNEGPEKAVNYCHFQPSEAFTVEDFRTLFVRSSTTIDDYKITSLDKINDDLYAVTLEIKDGENWRQIYNFVGKIDGNYRYMNSVNHIPSTMRENLNVDAYKYSDPNVFFPSEVG